ncbi:MAG: hypothetical protein ACKOCK_00660 [Chloroflexota bacterium]
MFDNRSPPDGDATPFHERVRSGDHPALTEPAVAAALATAGEPAGLGAEIGMFRLALARLLDEEQDASRFAAGVARLVAVAVQVMNAQRRAGVGDEAEFAKILQLVLPGMDPPSSDHVEDDDASNDHA